jgi:hypothetical protein
MKIFVGHGAYSGANHLRVHGTTHGAVMDLIRRGVDRALARDKVTEAVGKYPYPHVTMTTRNGAEVIEITRRDDL